MSKRVHSYGILRNFNSIMQRFNLRDRSRLSIPCKYWSSISMQRDIRSAPQSKMDSDFDMSAPLEMNKDLDLPYEVQDGSAGKVKDINQAPPPLKVIMENLRSCPQFPWLLGSAQQFHMRFVPRDQPSYNYLEFSIPPEGEVIKLGLSKQNEGRFHSSHKGWLVMINEENSEVFLLNPLSGAKHELPSLTKIPSFEKYGYGKADRFLDKIALSSSNISECTVAAIFSCMEIGVCRPGEKSWSITPILDDKKESPLCLLFSSCGTLYALVKNLVKNDETKSGRVITRTLRCGDGDELQLKLVYDKEDKSRKDLFYGHGIPAGFMHVMVQDKSYLVESSTNHDILLIKQITDHIKSDCTPITQTSDFLVYKIDQENGGSFIEVQSLGNQILFVTSRGCSFSFPVSNSERLEANCIYFVELGGIDRYGFSLPFRLHSDTAMCEFFHPFYLDGRKFGRNQKVYYHSAAEFTWGLSWLIPSF